VFCATAVVPAAKAKARIKIDCKILFITVIFILMFFCLQNYIFHERRPLFLHHLPPIFLPLPVLHAQDIHAGGDATYVHRRSLAVRGRD